MDYDEKRFFSSRSNTSSELKKAFSNTENHLFSDISIWDLYFYLKETSFEKWCDVEAEILDSLSPKEAYQLSFWEKVFNTYSVDYCNYSTSTDLSAIFLIIKYTNKINSKEEFYKILLQELNLFEHRFGSFVSQMANKNDPNNLIANQMINKINCKFNI